MSIQSEITRVSGEVTTQTELIRQIKEALEGKGAGSGGGTIVKEISFNELNDIVLNQLDSLKDRLILIKVSGDDEFCLQKFFYGNDILSASSFENKPIVYGGQVEAINYVDQFRNYFVAYSNAYLEIQSVDPHDILFSFDPAYQNFLDVDPIYGLSAQYYILQSENNTPDTPDTPSAPTVEQATPQINVSADGLITATATQEEGLVPAGTKTATYQLTICEGQVITPGTKDQLISKWQFLTDSQVIKGDANLIPGNIVSGKSIFGINGTAQSVEFIKEISVTLKDSQAIDGNNVWNSGIKIRVDGLKAGTTYKIYGGYFGQSYGKIFSGSLITRFDYSYETAKTYNWAIEDNYLVLPRACFSDGDILDLVIFKL